MTSALRLPRRALTALLSTLALTTMSPSPALAADAPEEERLADQLARRDLDAHLSEVRGRGLDPGEVVEADKGVRLSTLADPDGNLIRLIGGFRVRY